MSEKWVIATSPKMASPPRPRSVESSRNRHFAFEEETYTPIIAQVFELAYRSGAQTEFNLTVSAAGP
jgi:hypothetical protein